MRKLTRKKFYHKKKYPFCSILCGAVTIVRVKRVSSFDQFGFRICFKLIIFFI